MKKLFSPEKINLQYHPEITEKIIQEKIAEDPAIMGLGKVGPMSNYSDIPHLSKVILSLIMIIGRLEIITVFILFGRSLWRL